MVNIQAVRSHNADLKKLGSGLVAVFVGGTSGIGETATREFVRSANAPKVYIIGRNESQASKIIEELKTVNPEGKVSFLKSDISMLKNVDTTCDEIRSKEQKVNLLFLSPGVMTTKGRDETAEGLDKKLNLHYYSRMRFAHNLLPQLNRASESGELSRVVTVLSAGHEANLFLDDLPLKQHYSLKNCANHAITMNSLAVEQLAAQNPGTTFIHCYPGFVKTGLARDLGPIMTNVIKAAAVALTPFAVPIHESGERNLYAATSARFSPKGATVEGAVTGSDGVEGSGAYLLNWNGETTGNEKVLKRYREKGIGKDVWKHTLDVFEKICGRGEKL